MKRRLRGATLCSGIGAPEQALPEIDWIWSAEIDPNASRILKYRHSQSENLGDITSPDFISRARSFGPVDLLVAGTPCQAFSLAGARESLDDERGNLTLRLIHVARSVDVRCLLWENVPGILSTHDDAFGSFLGGLIGASEAITPPKQWTRAGVADGPLGAAAWRVLDAQYFRLAQRRRRVFVVFSPRNEVHPGEILFEWESLRRDFAPGRETGERVAGAAESCPATGGGFGTDFNCSGGIVRDFAPCLTPDYAKQPDNSDTGLGPMVIPFDTTQITSAANRSRTDPGAPCHSLASTARAPAIAGTLAASGAGSDRPAGQHNELDFLISHALNAGAMGRRDYETETFVTHSLTSEGFDASEDGTGRGIPLVEVRPGENGGQYADAEETDAGKILRTLRKEAGEEAFSGWGSGVLASLQSQNFLRSEMHGEGIRRAARETGSMLSDGSLPCAKDMPEGAMRPLWERERFRRSPQGWELPEQFAGQLGACLSRLSCPHSQAKAFLLGLWQAGEGIRFLRQALSEIQEVWRPAHDKSKSAHPCSSVRRLTPVEAERLQGFPDNYTNVDGMADGPRYRALGNSMAVPVIRWIGLRIVEALR